MRSFLLAASVCMALLFLIGVGVGFHLGKLYQKSQLQQKKIAESSSAEQLS